MSWWRRLFGGPKERESTSERAQWVPAEQNPFGVPILDLIRVTGGMTSATTNPAAAAMSVSWGARSVGEVPMELTPTSSVRCELRYPADSGLSDGWLFVPSVMEEKWVIAYRERRVRMIRSWSGKVLASAETRLEGGELVVERIDVAGDAIAAFGDVVATFDWMLRAHALEQVLPLPVSEEGARLLEATPLAVFSSFGKVAQCAATSWAPPPPERRLRAVNVVFARPPR